MPCTDGSTPVTIDRLFGFVNDGITQSPRNAAPLSSIEPINGATPAATAASRYANSQPSPRQRRPRCGGLVPRGAGGGRPWVPWLFCVVACLVFFFLFSSLFPFP